MRVPGYVVMNKMTYGRNWSADETRYFWDHMDRLQPDAMLFIDNDGDALTMKQRYPKCKVISRAYRSDVKEGEFFEKLSPQQVFNDYRNTPKGLIRNIMNEPSGYGDLKKLAHWVAETADLFGNAGIPICYPGWGEGHPDEKRMADLEEVWVSLDKWHDLHFYRVDEYGSHLGMLFNGGTAYDQFPWRVGRFETFTVPYLLDHGHKVPNTLYGEYGCDSAHDNTAFRGWTTCWNEQQYFEQLTAPIAKFMNKPYYAGACIFCWGNTGAANTQEDWITYDVSGAKGLHAKLETLHGAVVPPNNPAPVPDPNPPPPAPPTYTGVITIPGLSAAQRDAIRVTSTPDKK